MMGLCIATGDSETSAVSPWIISPERSSTPLGHDTLACLIGNFLWLKPRTASPIRVIMTRAMQALRCRATTLTSMFLATCADATARIPSPRCSKQSEATWLHNWTGVRRLVKYVTNTGQRDANMWQAKHGQGPGQAKPINRAWHNCVKGRAIICWKQGDNRLHLRRCDRVIASDRYIRLVGIEVEHHQCSSSYDPTILVSDCSCIGNSCYNFEQRIKSATNHDPFTNPSSTSQACAAVSKAA